MNNKEVNETVAQKLGWTNFSMYTDQPKWWTKKGIISMEPPDYAGSIQAAWEVMEKLQKEGYTLSLSWCTVGDHFEWILKIMGKEFTSEWADTAPLAICLSFLKLP